MSERGEFVLQIFDFSRYSTELSSSLTPKQPLKTIPSCVSCRPDFSKIYRPLHSVIHLPDPPAHRAILDHPDNQIDSKEYPEVQQNT